jgi:hypothetical protein
VCFLVPFTELLDTLHICNISWLRVKELHIYIYIYDISRLRVNKYVYGYQNQGASHFWKPHGLSRVVMGLLEIFLPFNTDFCGLNFVAMAN